MSYFNIIILTLVYSITGQVKKKRGYFWPLTLFETTLPIWVKLSRLFTSLFFLYFLFCMVFFLIIINQICFKCCFVFQYGEIEEMNVCDNLGDHLVGNVYIKVRFTSFICLYIYTQLYVYAQNIFFSITFVYQLRPTCNLCIVCPRC